MFEVMTGREYRSQETIIEVNDKVSVLGIVGESKSGSGWLEMQTVSSQNVSEQFMNDNNWDDWDKKVRLYFP